MIKFRYSAIDSKGELVEDEHTAKDKEALLEYLKFNDLNPLSVEEIGAGEADIPAAVLRQKKEESEGEATAAPTGKVGLSTGISRKETSVFTRQLATTLHAGLPLLRTISLLHKETTNPRLKKVLGTLGKRLQKGANLSEAMGEFPRVFEPMYINMIRVGEMSGDLPQCVGRLAILLEKDLVLRRRVRTALAYPTFIFCFTTILTYLLVAFLIPVFTPMFLASGLDLERDYPLTKMLITASQFATDPVAVGFTGTLLIMTGIFFKLASQTPRGKLIIDTVKISMPFLGKTVKEFTAARFARSFATLLQAGVPLVESLGLVAEAAGNELVATRVRQIGRRIQSGEQLSDTLRSAGLFPDPLIQMTSIGEEAGSLPDMLERVADYYDEELESSIASLTALLEPSMMVVIGGLVGVFVMGILLPILGISSGMENQL